MTIAQDIIHYIIGFTNWLHDQLNASPMLSKKSEKVAKKVGKLNGRNS